jgi:hypothetical protein
MVCVNTLNKYNPENTIKVNTKIATVAVESHAFRLKSMSPYLTIRSRVENMKLGDGLWVIGIGLYRKTIATFFLLPITCLPAGRPITYNLF